VPQVAAVMSTQVPRGSTAPAAVEVQVPVEQVRHAPAQALLQHTPWPAGVSLTQNWLWQSVLAVQVCPSTLGPQLLLTQAIPSAQSALVVQRELQAPFAHRYLPQSRTSEG
jgi:hypothetical protein